ncbi:MAG: glycerol-3-phosphate 1-O-acyltransferase PlsY [Hyphomicrobiaceae bacterium]
MTVVLLALLAGYLLGSIPFGLLLTRAAGLGDVRKIGSGNIGATNVLRTGNKKLAAATLLLDGLKGTAAVLLGAWLGAAIGRPGVEGLGMVAGLGAFLGHIFPIWLGFKGGKGVATYIGVLIGAAWPAALVFCGAWLAVAAITKYSSLSALVSTVLVLAYLVATGGPLVGGLAAVISALLYWKHRENIRRLIAGTESRIGARG